eukprot:TRINITY_DN7560_c0_g1_i6.p1 TRINITY_DN7560_c0_g1~~TRINITY_DN7560_c0_g1_i6.p1  ORF type:complete len:131 (+),score=46.57 TRINITY_DN7560_c0_g1_i6:95-487(+)
MGIETPTGARYMIQRRYKEFENLHKGLKVRFGKSGKPLPELPPKYNIFGKTPIQQREQGLEKYMKELFHYPNIGDSFLFRKFTNQDPRASKISFVDRDIEEGGNSIKGESPEILMRAMSKDNRSGAASQN